MFKWCVSSVPAVAGILRQVLVFLKVKRGEAIAFLCLAALKQCNKPGGRRAHPDAEAKIAGIVKDLKRADAESAYQEALDLAVYLRQVIFERDGR